MERAGGQAVAYRRAGQVVLLVHDRVEGRVAGLDASDRRLENFGGRHLFAGDQVGEADGVAGLVFRKTGHDVPLPVPGRRRLLRRCGGYALPSWPSGGEAKRGRAVLSRTNARHG